ncbi:MAG: class II fructose-bisphosphate aldolase [Candidatus Bathyarchaeia archaeon]
MRKMHVSMLEILKEAQKNRYAVGYFESWNLESARTVVRAAEKERSPLIIGFNGGILEMHKYELEYYASIGKDAVRLAEVPATLLLNEVSGIQQIVRAIRAGFSAVMIDVSHLPFEKAIDVVKKIVEISHLVDVCVEAQFDALKEAKNGVLEANNNVSFTDPKKAARFVEETDVDALSISVGNVHGLYAGKASLNLPLIQRIRETVDVPLVLHGATGISDDDIKRAVELGVCKINIGHALRLAFADTIRKALEKSVPTDLESISDLAENEMENLIRSKMKVYGCAGRV